jgi:hypothetical protein
MFFFFWKLFQLLFFSRVAASILPSDTNCLDHVIQSPSQASRSLGRQKITPYTSTRVSIDLRNHEPLSPQILRNEIQSAFPKAATTITPTNSRIPYS